LVLIFVNKYHIGPLIFARSLNLVMIFLKVIQFGPYGYFFTNINIISATCQFVVFLNFFTCVTP